MFRFRSGLGIAGAVAACLALAPAPAQAQADAETQAEDQWVTGNLTFLAYHEVGHLLLDQVMRADQATNRLAAEQSADDIATWLLSPDPGQPVDSAELVAAMEGWLESADQRAAGGPWDNPHYPDDETRAARIACLLIGSDTDGTNAFAALKPIAELHFQPSECRSDYQQLDRDMEAVFGDSDVTRANPQARVQVFHDPAPPALADAREFLINSRVLYDLQKDLVESIGAPVNVVLRGAACGVDSPGFQYIPSRREIVACYEEVDWFLFGDPQAGTPAAHRGASSADALGARPRRITPRPVQMQSPPPPRTPR